MLQNLFDEGIRKAGSQESLSEILDIPQTRVSAFRNYRKSGRKPNDIVIGQLAEYLGMNPIDTILLCKLETEDEEKATLLRAWLNKWHPVGDSNPCYRRERAIILSLKCWQGFYHKSQVIGRQMRVFLRCFDVAMTK